jgi:transglutaminase-like putative cysteine protease
VNILRLFCFIAVFLLTGCAAVASSTTLSQDEAVGETAVTHTSTTQYNVKQHLTLVNNGPGQPTKHNIWIALISDTPPYQTVQEMQITPATYQLITDEYGNRYAEFDLAAMPPNTTSEIIIEYDLSVNELTYDLANCEGELPDIFNGPELHIGSNNAQIVDLSERLSAGKQSACEKVEAFYNYIGNHLVYSYNGNSWGAQAALGEMGADCTEYASLLIALSRAAGIPARYLEGLHYFAGASEAIARTEHAWVEVYLPGVGWTPIDPTLGRSSQNRARYFGQHTPEHIIITQGRNPSTLRGASYWTHLYWPGNSAQIQIEPVQWEIAKMQGTG